MGMLSRFVLVMSVGLACACSNNPKPEDPSNKPDGETTTDSSDTGPASTVDLNDTSTPLERSSGVKATGVDRKEDGSVPDDYTLVENDCIQLGRKLGGLWRVELRASLSPKLNEKQREKAEESIAEGADKKADDWADGCIKSLVGKSADPKTLKCAMDSKDLKAFEKCLN
jgi:hypothetical protein